VNTGITQAAAALGWTVKNIDFDVSNPATLIAGLTQALQLHPAAVTFTGLPYAVWQSVVPAYAKAGVPLVPSFVGPVPDTPGVIANVGSPVDMALSAKLTSDWFIADSGGRGKALLMSVPDFPLLASYATQFTQDVRSACSGCSVKEVDATIPEVESNGADAQIVSSLQRDPSLKYVVSVNGAFVVGLPSALSAAGISGERILGLAGTTENQADILQGSESAWTGQPLQVTGWAVMDAVLRHIENMAIPVDDGGMPAELYVKGDFTTPTQDLNEPGNYQQLFEALWHVG
jgi:ribose transport system substrate-binding protein